MRDADRWWWTGAAGVTLGALARLLWGLLLHPASEHVYSDMGGYVGRAQAVAHWQTIGPVGGLFPPGTHLLLSVPFSIFGSGDAGMWAAMVLWCLLACLTPLLAWWFVRDLIDERAGALTAVLCALWPPFISFAGYFTSETPATTLLVLSLWLTLRLHRTATAHGPAHRFAIAAGVAVALTIAVRPQLSLNLFIAGLPLLYLWRRRLLVAAAVAGVVVPLTGILFVTHHLTGSVSLGANGGINFYQGHCDVHTVYTGPPTNSYWTASAVAVQQHRGHDVTFPNHLIVDQTFFYDQGLRCITAAPLQQAGLLARHVADLTDTTRLWPQADESGSFVSAVNLANDGYAFLLPLAIAVAMLQLRATRGVRREAHVELLAHLFCAVVLAAIYYGDPRFRVPYDVFGLALIASVITQHVRPRRRVTEPSGGTQEQLEPSGLDVPLPLVPHPGAPALPHGRGQ